MLSQAKASLRSRLGVAGLSTRMAELDKRTAELDKRMADRDADVDSRVVGLLSSSPRIAARSLPMSPDVVDLVVPRARRGEDTGQDLPVPPQALWTVDSHYLEHGATQVKLMFETLAGAGLSLEDADAVLEFGCSTGRMLRHLAEHAREHAVWGVDIDAESINWAQQHLSPPFRFTTCSTAPHLPFEDRSFGLVYAGSVFTHISELADSWLLELLRITRPDGCLYLTIQDQSWIEFTRAREQRDWQTDCLDDADPLLRRLGHDASVVYLRRGWPDAMVIHDRDSLLRSWRQHAEVVAVVDHAFHGQTAVTLRKRSRVPIPPARRRYTPTALYRTPTGTAGSSSTSSVTT